MKSGLDALYKRDKPIEAVRFFQQVLEKVPAHYGAALQLAKSLDAAGRWTEARAEWRKVFATAKGIKDEETLRVAGTRLVQPDGTKLDDLLAAGLDSQYIVGDPPKSVELFRRVLRLEASHYGANFQLARALDLAGRKDEARAQWQLVLRLASAVADVKTMDEAKARLAQDRPSRTPSKGSPR